jgi:hypothetical protein
MELPHYLGLLGSSRVWRLASRHMDAPEDAAGKNRCVRYRFERVDGEAA